MRVKILSYDPMTFHADMGDPVRTTGPLYAGEPDTVIISGVAAPDLPDVRLVLNRDEAKRLLTALEAMDLWHD